MDKPFLEAVGACRPEDTLNLIEVEPYYTEVDWFVWDCLFPALGMPDYGLLHRDNLVTFVGDGEEWNPLFKELGSLDVQAFLFRCIGLSAEGSFPGNLGMSDIWKEGSWLLSIHDTLDRATLFAESPEIAAAVADLETFDSRIVAGR